MSIKEDIKEVIEKKFEETKREVLEEAKRIVDRARDNLEFEYKKLKEELEILADIACLPSDNIVKIFKDGIIGVVEFINKENSERYLDLMPQGYTGFYLDEVGISEHIAHALRHFKVKPKHKVTLLVIAWQDPISEETKK